MKKLLLTLLISFIGFTSYTQVTTDTYTYTGAIQNFVVPPCVYSLDITSAGAEGGGNLGGNGTTISYTVAVNPGDNIQIIVGGEGTSGGPGYNGGGSGYASTNGNNAYNSYGGGGSTDISINGVQYSVASGGGGQGGGSNNVAGGNGGCNAGSNGNNTFGAGGQGGTQFSGGTGGAPWAGTPPGGQNGSLGQGGNGGLWQTASGGGGGGGYYGGGGGGNDGCCTGANGGGGGGGGSSLVPFGAACTGGNNTGNGSVSITYTLLPLTSTVNAQVCPQTAYTFPDGSTSTINADLTQIDTILSVNGCDSIITTNIVVLPEYTVLENVTICSGDGYMFPDGVFTPSILFPVAHISDLFTVDGCDSIITTQILLYPEYSISEFITLCEGESFTFHDGVTFTNINVNLNYQSFFNTINGCDSVYTEFITVIPNSINVVDTLVCYGTDFIFPDGTPKDNVIEPTSYVSVLTSVNGCDSLVTVNVDIFPTLPLDINMLSNGGCTPFNALISSVDPYVTYLWTITNGLDIYSFTDPTVDNLFSMVGSYDVTLEVTTTDGCTLTQTFPNAFEVYPNPVSLYGWNPNTGTVINNQITFNNSSFGGTSYTWDFGDGTNSTEVNPYHSYQDTGKFITSLIVENQNGCRDTSYGLVIIQDVFYIYVPNVFTPDQDEKNNIFLPRLINVNAYHLTLFNRWGEIVFESYDPAVGWDGTYSNQGLVEDGVYIWVIDVVDINQRKVTYRGHVTVLK